MSDAHNAEKRNLESPNSLGTDERHQQNRAAWNEAAHYYEITFEQAVEFLKAGGKNLLKVELPCLERLSEWCERAIHLQCAGGTDTLSLWNHGAREVVGVDISDRMIDIARRKGEAIGAPASWHRSDVLDTPHELDGTADLVYTGRGAIGWIMDLQPWARVIHRLLKPGGRFYLFEGHPLGWVWHPDGHVLEFDPNPPYGNYFERTVGVTTGWPETYIPKDVVPSAEQQAKKNEHQWTLGDIINSIISAGLILERFEEHPDLYWDMYPNLPKDTISRLPNTFSLLARKPAP